MREGRIVQSADPQSLYRDPVDPEVALFVGEAVLLNAGLSGDDAETPLGCIPVRGVTHGARGGVVMLRPEQISCHDRPLSGSPRGRVIATEFYGHDASARISLHDPAGFEITARCAGHHLPRVGDEVSILVEGTALAYAETNPSPSGALPVPAAL
jgi:iron(III) transport system ATP-binding protein